MVHYWNGTLLEWYTIGMVHYWNGTNHSFVATSVRKLLVVFVAPTQREQTIVSIEVNFDSIVCGIVEKSR